jgi:hypothetical protein
MVTDFSLLLSLRSQITTNAPVKTDPAAAIIPISQPSASGR